MTGPQRLIALLFAGLLAPWLYAHGSNNHTQEDSLIADWTFLPNYTLQARAANLPEGRNDPKALKTKTLGQPTDPILLNGNHPTQRITNLINGSDLPSGPFTVEWWINNHSKEPYGALIAARDKEDAGRVAWALTYDYNEFGFHLRDDLANTSLSLTRKTKRYEGHREYWWHTAAVLRR